ncbi:MAG: MFS transporter, partial [Pontibacterium sp.]
MPFDTTHARLSCFYFFYFALLGLIIPYFSLYLSEIGYSAALIGILAGSLHATRVVAPSLWGWIADRTGKRVQIIQLGSVTTCITFGGIFIQDSFTGLLFVIITFSFFWNAVMPQFEVVTLRHLGQKKERYSQIRVWGSIGFILFVVAFGWVFDLIPVIYLPHIMRATLGFMVISAYLIPPPPASTSRLAKGEAGKLFLKQLRRPQVIIFFIVHFLVQMAHGAYYTFFSVLMEELGYTRTEIGGLWMVGVIAEIILFIFMHRLIKNFGYRLIMLVSLGLCVIRWSALAWMPENVLIMVIVQLFHAATFGCMHAVAIALVDQYFSEETHGQGQAFLSGVGFGAGGATGAFISGFVWSQWGGEGTFMMAAVVSLAAILLTYIWVRPEKAQQNTL